MRMTGIPLPEHSPTGTPAGIGGVQLSIDVRVDGDTALVSVSGELDLAAATRLDETLSLYARRVDGFVFDLSGVTFVDLAGLELITTHCDGPRAIRASSRVVDRLLQLMQAGEGGDRN